MALIVENGSGLQDAESYISVADATAYHAARGSDAWAAIASDTVREQLLRKATDYMGQVYRSRWAGARLTVRQALDWPRYGVPRTDTVGGYGTWPAYYDTSVIPQEVQRACAELALRAASSDLSPDIGRQAIREKVDVIEVEYDANAPVTTSYRAVDGLLQSFLAGNGNSAKVIRS